MLIPRLIVLLFAPAQWLLIWCVQYVRRLPINQSLQGGVAAFAGAVTVVGTWMIQGGVYRSMTGISVPAQDNYLFAVMIGESLVSLGVVFLIANKLRSGATAGK